MKTTATSEEKQSLLVESDVEDEFYSKCLDLSQSYQLAIDELREQEGKVKKKRRTLKAVIGTMTVLAISAAIIVGCVLGFSNSAPTKAVNGFTLDDVLSGKFSPKGFNGTWISDQEMTLADERGDLVIYNIENGAKTIVISSEQMDLYNMHDQWLSSDRKYLLFNYDYVKIWRHSSRSRYAVLNLQTQAVTHITVQGLADPPLLNYATFSPADNNIAFVYANNVYYMDNPESSAMQITSDGSANVFNGIPDWVYEEEVLGADNALWFSPNGKKLVYATFYDELVRTFEFPYYGTPGTPDSQYTKSVPIKYPKPGTTNPSVRITSVDLTYAGWPYFHMQPPVRFVQPRELDRIDHLFTTATWATDNEFFICWSNRRQNQSYFSLCEADSGVCNSVHTYLEPRGWNEFFTAPKFSTDGSKFVIIHPVQVEAEGNLPSGKYKHVVLFSNNGGAWVSSNVTYGHFEVTEIISWDQARNKIFAIGTEPGLPSVRRLYEADVSSRFRSSVAKCLTCTPDCRWSSVDFSEGSTYYAHTCSGPEDPSIVILKKSVDHSAVIIWEDNAVLRESLQTVLMPKSIDLRIPVGEAASKYFANVRLLMPQSYDSSNPGAKKFPVLVYVYGGPQSQQVADRFGIAWGHHVASRDVIYALIDGRGSGYQGDNLLFEINRGMGTVEIEDQIAVMRVLQTKEYVNATKTAIWGWSYGGFATAAVMAKDVVSTGENPAFHCGMSVAPVTNWIYYDSIYTERYMGLPTPEDNEFGYNRTDLTRMVDNFRHKKFFLLHGTADDNVHYQQAMMLAKSLEAADILFRSQSYPDENHSIGSFKKHLYHSLTAFLLQDCFSVESNEIV